ncbi:hypothetical protein WJX72_009637 [[Myrmecia] bisecta]|uniref:ABC transporter domain-containing protein n=1 Tax=[Myrmecia] bisecta TaxID=41462 RepID=A0AAW1P774_9CHLO
MDNVGDRRTELNATFRTQANALLRKNVVYQKRKRRTNCCIVLAPIFFCLILLLLQIAVNSALNSADNRCGCKCLTCCTKQNGVDICHDNTADNPCRPGVFDSCKVTDDTQCGLQYSSGSQASYCAVANPSSWPPFLQVPEPEYRAQPARPATTSLYTAQDRTTGEALAQQLFAGGADPASVAAAQVALQASSNAAGVQGEGFTLLGLTLGTPATAANRMYVESAFINATGVYNMVPDCASDTSTAQLNTLLAGTGLTGQNNFTCTAAQTVWSANASAIDGVLYCGWKDARCNATTNAPIINAYDTSYDFLDTGAGKFRLAMYLNDTNIGNPAASRGPEDPNRIQKPVNQAVNAFLVYALGTKYKAQLLAIMDFPKLANKLRLDFSSLLGPIFYCWLAQLLLPVMMVSLVYEKEKSLRIMMKMHGLGDGAYWAIQYAWFLMLYIIYIFVLIAFGSLIDLKFFRLSDYGLQIVFYLLWGNCLIAFAFLASTFFRNTKTAVVSSFLYVFGTGLLGSLLLETFFDQDVWWVNIVEIIPAFALYRGLYEFAQYAFRGSYQNATGLTFARLSDHKNGMPVVLIIMAVEWLVFLPLAWYLEKVIDSSTGVRQSPLFFLERWRKSRAVGAAGPSGSQTPASASTELSASAVQKDAGKADSLLINVESADVREERLRVEELGASPEGQSIIVQDLRKVYPGQDGNPDKLAVKGLSMAVARGECFGLLGPNGAGKSTSISMLVGLLEPTSGTARIEGCDIRSDMPAIYNMMGVCPQHDLLWEQLTAREHLHFYGRLKNVKGPQLAAAVDASLRSVNLFNGGVGDKQVRQYSGGMKRRLSVAISLIGAPLVVYLDEPSTGLDPASRRNLWDVVKNAKKERGIILTTHSMEEAEVLCDRLGIFVDGQLVCVGNPRELTARYGGYLVFTIMTANEDVAKADAFVRQLAPTAKRTYGVGGTQKYELPTSEVSLSSVFAGMERAKQQFQVLDWGVAHATLEEVFIKFAKSIGAEGGN